MQYQKIINLLDNTQNQTTKFRTKNWVEINDDSNGKYNTNSQIKFKTSRLRSGLCDYSDAYILASGTITITGAGADDVAKPLNERNKGVIFKNSALFTDCINEISNTQIANVKYLDVVIPMHNLIEYSNNYPKTSGSLWQYYRDDPNDNITESESFKYRFNITGKTPAAGNTKDARIAVPLKYLSNFWRTLEMPLIVCETNLTLTWCKYCVISSAIGKAKFKITDKKIYALVVT